MRRQSNKKEVRQKREPAHLSGKLDARLLTYAIAASAAGVGMMAQPHAAEAEVIATPANISVPQDGGLIQFDINRDGQMDFGLSWVHEDASGHHRKTCSSLCPPPTISELKIVPARAANEIWQVGSKVGFGGTSDYYCAAALAPGRRVNAAAKFTPGEKGMFWYYQFFGGAVSACPFRLFDGHGPYLGVEFLDTGGNLHYGWVRVSIGQGRVTITGYAYETTPNMVIKTGVTHGPVGDARTTEPIMLNPGSAPASLGMLALGAPGLVAWRRPEEELQSVA
jgi:hypothetical protein